MHINADPLTGLPAHLLDHINGDRRKRLVEYLLRWDERDAALRALDIWLERQPNLATLREFRARTLIELGRAEEALTLLDGIDAERGMSQSRRMARIQALAVLGQWDAAHALIEERPDDPTMWRQRADLWREAGRFDAAAAAYSRAAELMPEGTAPLRGLAELALAQGQFEQARTLLLQRQTHLAEDVPLDTRDLLLLREVSAGLGSTAAVAELDSQIAQRRATEQQSICDAIGYDPVALNEAAGAEADSAQAAAEPRVQASVTLHDTLPEPQLPEAAWQILREQYGFNAFRPGQAQVIDRVLRGEDVLAVLPTGAGKSLTYQLPALLLPGATLVLSPLIALMKDQFENLPPALSACATTIHSGLDTSEVGARLRGVAEGRYKLIYVAPERLRQQSFVHALRRVGVARVVVDEAHCVSLWGISFRPDYLFIRRALDELGKPPVLALTATATPDTESEIKTHLGELTTVRTSIFRPNLRFEVQQVANKRDKLGAIADLCRAIDGPIVVYVRSRDGCEEVAAHLRQQGITAEHYHAQVSDRAAVQDRFMGGATRVLVATVAFGMGVDKADVRAIIHYNLPQSVEAYYQEAGRAGRDGAPARCVLLYAPADKGQLTAWLREDVLTKEYLRRVYLSLRRFIRSGWGIVAFDDLRHELGETDETRLRVALGLLERVNLLARHFDLPRLATLTLREAGADDTTFQQVVREANLVPGLPTDVNLLTLAEQCEVTPDALERQILCWRDAGLVRYDGAARDVLLELRPPPADVGEQIDALLTEYATRQDERVEAIAAYARGVTCRHRAVAAHFGERLAPCGTACDICAAGARRKANPNESRLESVRPTGVPAAVRDAILDVVREMPGRLNDKDVVCVLLGLPGYPECEAYGRLAGARFNDTRAAIATLVSNRVLAYRNRTLIVPDPSSRPVTEAELDAVILRCIANLPFPVGKSGLAKILKGASGSPIGPERCADYAVLGHMTVKDIETAIMRLVERGDLLRRDSGMRPLLSLTERGAATMEQAA